MDQVFAAVGKWHVYCGPECDAATFIQLVIVPNANAEKPKCRQNPESV